MKKLYLFIMVFTVIIQHLFSQGVGIGTNSPNQSSQLDVNSTTKGVLIPRLTSSQRNAIASPANGLLVFDIEQGSFYYYFNNSWYAIANGSAGSGSGTTTSVTSNDVNQNDQFGFSVAIDGDYAIVGAPTTEVGNYTDAGCAYIFQKVNNVWQQQAKLTSVYAENNAHFGYSVAISGEYVIVGAPDANISHYLPFSIQLHEGRASIFHRTGTNWTEDYSLTANEGESNYQFGFSVAIKGDTVVCGAPGGKAAAISNPILLRAGCAFTFVRNGTTWNQQSKLIGRLDPPPDYDYVSDNGRFGSSVSISSDYILCGAPEYREYGQSYTIGIIFAYKRSGNDWIQTAFGNSNPYTDLYTFNKGYYSRSGYSVSISDSGWIYGAPNGDYDIPWNVLYPPATSSNTGGFAPNGSVPNLNTEYAVSQIKAANSYLGNAVAAGTKHFAAACENKGYVLVYNINPYTFKTQITRPNLMAESFGHSVAINGTTLIVGSPNDRNNSSQVQKGAIYFYNLGN